MLLTGIPAVIFGAGGVIGLRPHRIGETMADADGPVPREELIGVLASLTPTKTLPTRSGVRVA